jgi:hypothetical protein
VYERMWKNIFELDRLHVIIWRMFIVCWIPKARNIHSEYGILIVFPLQQCYAVALLVEALRSKAGKSLVQFSL